LVDLNVTTDFRELVKRYFNLGKHGVNILDVGGFNPLQFLQP
jgi:hypothetical protein